MHLEEEGEVISQAIVKGTSRLNGQGTIVRSARNARLSERRRASRKRQTREFIVVRQGTYSVSLEQYKWYYNTDVCTMIGNQARNPRYESENKEWSS